MKILNLFILILFSLNSFSETDLTCSGFKGTSLESSGQFGGDGYSGTSIKYSFSEKYDSAKANWAGVNTIKENLTLIASNSNFVSFAATYDEIFRIHTLFFKEGKMFLTEIQTQAFTGNAQVRAYKASICN